MIASGPDASGLDRAWLRDFVRTEIAPRAQRMDLQQRFEPSIIDALASHGLLGADLPAAYGGRGFDALELGALAEELGRACAATRTLITVHHMAAHAILRWGTEQQKARWLPRFAAGEIGAVAFTEAAAGSDLGAVAVEAVRRDGGFVLRGRKRWISFGQLARRFLVLARTDGGPAMFVVERDTGDLAIEPVQDLLGLRASMTAELELTGCFVPADHLLGKSGFGLQWIAGAALDHGRYTVAWGCVGLARACLEASVRHAAARQQFGNPIASYQLVRRMLTDMHVGVEAASSLCHRAGQLRRTGDAGHIGQTMIAKYFAARTAMRAALAAVQIHGAEGCSGGHPAQRCLRDAKIMEIIEGSNEMHQIHIADLASQAYLGEQ